MKTDKILIENENRMHLAAQAEENRVQWSLQNKMHPGHTMWEINTESGDIVAAKFDDGTDVVFSTRLGNSNNLATVTKKIKMNKGCVYIPALKRLGAINKFAKAAQKYMSK
ncbi:MAG: hypothetical protein KA161_07700 [Saprospiraceae bacterium]|nr:hypothetical protein [Saprospiraceae bacterium]